jgi:hypothetical protein
MAALEISRLDQMFEDRRRMTSGTKRDGNDSLEEITLRSLVDKFDQRVNAALHPSQDLAQMTAVEAHEAALALDAGAVTLQQSADGYG